MQELAHQGALHLINRHQMASLEEAKLAKKLAKKRKHKEVQQASERVAAEEPAISKKQKRDKKKEAGSAASEAADPSAVLNRLSADIDNLDEGSNGQTLGLTDRLTVSTVPNKKKKKQKQDQRLQNGTKEVSTSQSMEDDQPLPKKLKTKKKRAQEAQLANGSPVLIDPQATISGGRLVDQPAASKLAVIGNRESAQKGMPLRKALYREHAEVAAMTDAIVSGWQAERDIAVEGTSLRPVQCFHQSGLPEAMLHATRNFVSPSPVQGQCLPIVLSGRDLVGIAATGSGKTLAFGLPCLRHIQAQRDAGSQTGGAPRALMLSPTRELAQQIAAVMEEAGEKVGIKTLCVYGGVPKPPQAKQLKRGVDIVVATPGRLEDLMNDEACKVEQVSYLVLDEADRMLDLGFEPHIRAIAGKTRADRQTLMFSATWPTEVQKLAMDYLVQPVRVVIGSQELSASHSVTQIVEVIEPEARERRLIELLRKYHSSRKNRVLVFVLYKKEASRVEQNLQRAGWKAASIHGDISQAQRSRAVEQFKSGELPLLIATDVAARGLDIPDVEAVINYSFPLTTEDYVHRIGRTGRAGKTGTAHTFFSGATDKARSGELINVLREAGQPVPPELLAFGVTTKKKESKLYGAHFREIDMSQKATKIVFDD